VDATPGKAVIMSPGLCSAHLASGSLRLSFQSTEGNLPGDASTASVWSIFLLCLLQVATKQTPMTPRVHMLPCHVVCVQGSSAAARWAQVITARRCWAAVADHQAGEGPWQHHGEGLAVGANGQAERMAHPATCSWWTGHAAHSHCLLMAQCRQVSTTLALW
jgi:hypothetical protein